MNNQEKISKQPLFWFSIIALLLIGGVFYIINTQKGIGAVSLLEGEGTPGIVVKWVSGGGLPIGSGTPDPVCVAKFLPFTISSGKTTVLSWSSTDDADGNIPYSCTGSIASGTLNPESGTKTFAPTNSQTCTFTVANSSGVTNTCTATINVGSGTGHVIEINPR